AAGHAGLKADLLEAEPPQVTKEIIGRAIVGDIKVHSVVTVQIGRDDPQTAPERLLAARALRHIDITTGVVSKKVVRSRGNLAGITVKILTFVVETETRVVGIPHHVVADVKIEVSVIVEIGKGR